MKKFAIYYELAARIHVFILLNLYGIGKIAGGQFYRKGKLPAEIADLPLAEVGAFDLAWTFMGYSFLYIFFVGFFQIIGAWCLLWERTKLIGILILMPILVNIIVFDFIFLPQYDAICSAVIYFIQLNIVLFLNKERVIRILKIMFESPKGEKNKIKERVKMIGIALVIVALIFAFEQGCVNFFGR
ncbi:MAG: hypothetical protein ACI85O_000664 [Saprospiraceae bacterium]|jgi:hypothetical protein